MVDIKWKNINNSERNKLKTAMLEKTMDASTKIMNEGHFSINNPLTT